MGLTQRGSDLRESSGMTACGFATYCACLCESGGSQTAIRGEVCGVRAEDVAESLMREILCLDKLIDELASCKPMDKILRL